MRLNDFQELIFADDLNAFKGFTKKASDDELQNTMTTCQQNLHSWGRANQVQFDPGKESQHILAIRGRGRGGSFKLLGVSFDVGLTMEGALHEIVKGASGKISSILRTSRYFGTRELIGLYKAKILSFVECRTAAIYHTCDSHLEHLDRLQRWFLREIGVSELEALHVFHLAPLTSRRDIAMLGLVHRTVLRQGPQHFQQLSAWYLRRRHPIAREQQRGSILVSSRTSAAPFFLK